jgi:hypothetical protein
MKGYNDDLVMSLAIGCWLLDNNSNTYNVSQIQYSDALLKGMQVNNTNIKNTVISPFYTNKQNSVNPFIPVSLPEGKFAGQNNINRKNPLGDLRWLIRK